MTNAEPAAFQYSLRSMLCVVLITGILFGLTFKMYSGGFTPGKRNAETYRAESEPKGMHLFGNFSTFGIPFTAYESGATFVVENPDQTIRVHHRFIVLSVAGNLVFWFLFSCGLWRGGWYIVGLASKWKTQ